MTATPTAPEPLTSHRLIALAVDVVAVLVFALIGGASHGSGGEVLRIAWPFVVGLLTAWALPHVWRVPWLLWPAGVTVWVLTTGIGLVLRWLTGGGVSGAMPWITVGVLGVLLLVARPLVGRIVRARSPRTREGLAADERP